jgi:hypothetical protein
MAVYYSAFGSVVAGAVVDSEAGAVASPVTGTGGAPSEAAGSTAGAELVDSGAGAVVAESVITVAGSLEGVLSSGAVMTVELVSLWLLTAGGSGFCSQAVQSAAARRARAGYFIGMMLGVSLRGSWSTRSLKWGTSKPGEAR